MSCQNAHLFLKDKYLSDGSFDNRKARLVANGNEEGIEDIGETASPTINPINVFTQLNLAAVNRRTTISSYDIESVFTITPVDSEKLAGKKKYVRVRSDIVKYFLEVDPTLSQYVDIVFELAYWLYSYVETCRSFFELLKPTKPDKCLYTWKTSEGKVIIVATHADDSLVATSSDADRVQFEEKLKRNFISRVKTTTFLM
jgi:hypothetical protein